MKLSGAKSAYKAANHYTLVHSRQPNSDIDKLEELEKMISSITETQQNLPNIILGGDFNLPHINWQSTTVNTNPQYGKALNDKMVEITNNNDLTQVINVPTR